MFTSKIIGIVKRELMNLCFKFDDICVVKILKDKYILNVYDKDTSYLVEYYENGCKDLNRYHSILEANGINSVKIVAKNEHLLIYDNYEMDANYRFARKEDLENEDVIIGLARWYKKLHGIKGYLLNNYNNYFSLENIIKVMDRYNFRNNNAFVYICNNFDNINLKLNRMETGLIYGDFDLNNVVITNDGKVFVIDYRNIKTGYVYSDISKVLKNVEEKYHELFINESGHYKKDDIIVDEVVSCVIGLYMGIHEEDISVNTKKCLEMVNNGNLYRAVKSLVEWY